MLETYATLATRAGVCALASRVQRPVRHSYLLSSLEKLTGAAMPVALAASAALLLYNGTIRTNTLSLDAVTPALCFDSTIKATGSLDAVAAACPGARRVDLAGATAVPPRA